MTLRPLLLLLATTFASAPLASPFSAPLGQDQHLDPTPRTASEQARITAVTRPTTDFSKAERFEQLSAGAASSPASASEKVFKLPSANMAFERKMQFVLGEALFEKLWVSSPSSTKASDGVGPLYNARSCARCHPGAGRGTPPLPQKRARSFFLRLSIPGGTAPEGIDGYIPDQPEPTYGRQLQNVAVGALPPEGQPAVRYEETLIELADGTVVHLRKPHYQVDDPGYGPLHPQAMLSPRVAQQMIGLGLLESIPAQAILDHADPEDADGDGISGRAQIVTSEIWGEPMLGRFGHKAGAATVYRQSAGAFHGDVGISSPLFPQGYGECTAQQVDCRTAPDGNSIANDGLEIGGDAMDAVSFYAENLAVPMRRKVNDPSVLRGKELFYQSGCIACHRPKFVTHRLEDRPEQSFQLIWPYTDLLLHDMGEGLADHRPEARANGYEWRTAPLWGIGLTRQVSGHTYFLHDGRARNLLEAILWHGGEASQAQQRVIQMPAADRDALIEFLQSL
ncbi:MAG: thiol oxidoreductase [Rhodobacterales bacterium]|nr:MAG: thiol oxidoreductase [Rhodobacterales bacterium]